MRMNETPRGLVMAGTQRLLHVTCQVSFQLPRQQFQQLAHAAQPRNETICFIMKQYVTLVATICFIDQRAIP
jgi:hypothetical protein